MSEVEKVEVQAVECLEILNFEADMFYWFHVLLKNFYMKTWTTPREDKYGK